MQVRPSALMVGHALLRQWLETLEQDAQEVARLYHPAATLWWNERQVATGRSGVEDLLASHHRKWRHSSLEALRILSCMPTHVRFESRIQYGDGYAILHHEWLLAADRIQEHRIEILRYEMYTPDLTAAIDDPTGVMA